MDADVIIAGIRVFLDRLDVLFRVQPKATEVEGIQSQLLQLRVNALREMAPLLSEEQRQKLAQMNPRRGHWRHRGPAQQG